MKNKILFVFIIVLLLSFSKNVLASELCSPSGYTIVVINGMFTDENEAMNNRDSLRRKFTNTHNNEPLKIDYLHNATHLIGIGDTVNVVAQGVFNQKSDYDLVEMIKNASEKIKTQKVLLVGYSQGNFYANNFYDKVSSQIGGIPSQSIGVYSIATPASRVAGNGKYLTSDTDRIIINIAGKLFNVLPPNVHIPLKKSDGDGHGLSYVYLKYQGDRVVSDTKSLLNKLKNNEEQNVNEPCISPPKISKIHDMQKVIFAIVDPVANMSTRIADGAGNVGIFVAKTFKGLLASVGGSSSGSNDAIPLLAQEQILIDIENTSANKVEVEITKEISVVDNANNQTNEILQPVISNPSNVIHNSGGTSGASTPELENNITPTPEPTPEPEPETVAEPEEEIIPVVTDTTKPIISIIGGITLNVAQNTNYIDAGATALDETDGDLTSSIIKGGTFIDTTTLGVYTITYTVKDLSNNSTTSTRAINIIFVPLPPIPPTPPIPPANTNDFVINKDTILTAGEYNYDNLLITNNAKLILQGSPNSVDEFKGVKINAKNITVDSGSYIYADGQGYTEGPGAAISPEDFAGASYGGAGHRNTLAPTYGKATEPTDLGSGGYNLFRGGGAIILTVSETLLNNGIISANGDSTSSGGSIYVKTKGLSGTGIFSANGGGMFSSGLDYGTGGGGRIALYYEELLFTGKAEALGGCGQYDGMTTTCTKNGTVGFFDTLNNNFLANSFWLFQKNDSPFNFNRIIITDGAIVASEKETAITANELLVDKKSQFKLAENQVINIPLISIKDSSELNFSGKENLTAETITITEKSIVTIVPEQILSLTVVNLNIGNDSLLSVDAKGYVDGPGASSLETAGASYGGLGGNNVPGSIYGDSMKPIDFGSGGYSGFRGGGAIRIIATGTLSNDGIISANGNVTSSGGSIYVTAENISGGGIFSANGGGMHCSGICISPGGGGRVAIYYKNNLFTGQVLALGANSYLANSADGTVKLIDDTVPILSSEKLITSFDFGNPTPKIIGSINNTDYTITLTAPYGTDVSELIPTIVVSEKSSVVPLSASPQNFTNPVTYTVKAEDNSTQSYIVTVIISPNSETIPVPDPVSEDTPPSIKSYTFNGVQSDITIDPTINNLSIILNANKNVDWMDVRIEKADNPSVNKFFRAGNGCVNGTSSCKKIWDGILSSGELLQSKNYNGIYKFKVHIRDSKGVEYTGYLPSIITVNVQ